MYVLFFFFFLTLLLSSFWSSRGHRCRPFPHPPRFLFSIFIAHRVQRSHCSSIFHRVLLTHALALSASQFVHKKKSQRIYTSMHSAGLKLTKLTYARLEDNLIRHRGDRSLVSSPDPATTDLSRRCGVYPPARGVAIVFVDGHQIKNPRTTENPMGGVILRMNGRLRGI